MTKVEFDPKLRACMKEIKKVMQKYDCGGFVNLASKSHAEWEMIMPAWANTQFNPKGELVIQHRRANPEATAQTLHLLFTTRDTCTLMAKQMQHVYDSCKGVLDVEHKVQIPHFRDN